MKKKILFVSLSFPPKSDPEGLQTAKYFHYLQRHTDLQIDVVTSAVPTLYMPYDPDLEPYTAGVNQLVPVKLRENRYVNFLRNRLGLEGSVFPDGRSSFHKQYKKVLKRLKDRPDLIYSRADPKSSTVMAYKLKQELGVPWILHMSDPWADCPLQTRTAKQYALHDKWERECVAAADIVSLTSMPTVDFYKKKYPEFEGKFRFFPNVYGQLKDSAPVAAESNDKFRIVYTGGLAEERSPSFLLEALKQLQQEQPSLTDGIEVIFAGGVDARNRTVFEQYSLPFVKWIGMLPFREALKLQRTANLLVVIDNPIDDPAMSMFFPSKLLDYMVARKRILAITTRGSASDLVMRDLKGDVCAHRDTDEIKNAIVNAYAAYRSGNEEYLVNEQPPQKYEAVYNADRLYHEIKSLIHV